MVSMGCIVSGGRVTNSILSHDVRINSYTEVESSIIFSHVNVGRYSRIRRAIIDRAVHIPERTEIGFDLEEDRKKYHVSEGGIVVVVPEPGMFEDRKRAASSLPQAVGSEQ
jgi:glucose-1-phosphate adenylyltransferase